MYVDYIIRKYSRATVVFDGYTGKPSTKDPAHVRRLNGRKVGPDILFDDDTLLFESKDTFLSNPNNKQGFIDKLSKALMENGFHTAVMPLVMQTASYEVQTSPKRARESQVVLTGEDTDLLVLLLHHVTQQHMMSQSKSAVKIWDIKATQAALGEDVCTKLAVCSLLGKCFL
ncbi:hypothetical protein BaRGS_00039995 [Batillaria attramentaria]|uniref:Uncharacterized protein n=1 Tax=Batillaria attramentaria TaxID=370345 RepID=A0ABD0J1V5_9CAEN